MNHDIYQIIESLNAAQKSVKQLPALFKPKDVSPVLSGPYGKDNATQGYLVGETQDEGQVVPMGNVSYTTIRDKKDYLDKRDLLFRILSQPGLDPETIQSVKEKLRELELAGRNSGLIKEGEEDNPMAQAVIRRIANAHPELLLKYGPKAVMQAVADVTEGSIDWEEISEIGSSDVSAYVNYVKDTLRDRMGSCEEMDDRRPFAEDDDKSAFMKDVKKRVAKRDAERYRAYAQDGKSEVIAQIADRKEKETKDLDESKESATEDVLSTVKKKLGDYLQDVATAIQKDPDLMDKIPQDIDQVKAVKTIRTDDGHEIKILGNEDDGFRISIKDRPSKARFKSLDEATMACEMYCAHRREKALSADYIEEKHIS